MSEHDQLLWRSLGCSQQLPRHLGCSPYVYHCWKAMIGLKLCVSNAKTHLSITKVRPIKLIYDNMWKLYFTNPGDVKSFSGKGLHKSFASVSFISIPSLFFNRGLPRISHGSFPRIGLLQTPNRSLQIGWSKNENSKKWLQFKSQPNTKVKTNRQGFLCSFLFFSSSTSPKNISQIGSLPQKGMKIQYKLSELPPPSFVLAKNPWTFWGPKVPFKTHLSFTAVLIHFGNFADGDPEVFSEKRLCGWYPRIHEWNGNWWMLYNHLELSSKFYPFIIANGSSFIISFCHFL